MLELDLTVLNLVDLLAAVIIVLGVLSGWGRGFLVATLGLMTLAVSLVLALVGYHRRLTGCRPLHPRWACGSHR